LLVTAPGNYIRSVTGISVSFLFNNFQNCSFAVRDSRKSFTEVKNNCIGRTVFFQYSFQIRVGQFFKICFNSFVFQRFNEDFIGLSGFVDFEFIPGGIKII
jgi:hypothetical protein